MKRFAIRDNNSPNTVKTRVFDFIITDDGEKKLEVKDGRVIKTILLEDVKKQINEYEKQD